MTEEVHPIARALLGDGGDEPDRTTTCSVCGSPCPVDGFIVRSVKIWNEHATRKEDLIRPSEMGIACAGDCTAKLYARKHEEYQRDNETTRAFLAMLHVGKYNPESLAWLRQHGCGKYVERLLAKEGTAKANV